MILSPFAPGAVSAQRNGDYFVSLRNDLGELQRQLSTGRRSESFGGLGFERRSSLDLRARVSTLEGYQAAIQSADLRIKLMLQNMDRLTAISSDTRSDVLLDRFDVGPNGRTTASTHAQDRMKEAIDLLNSDYGGRYLFSGRSVDVAPVASYDRIMNGDPVLGKNGLKTLIAERKQADLGTTGLGRLALTPPPAAGTGMTLSEDTASPGVRLNFGFLLKGASSTGGNIAATYTAATDPTATLSAQPAAGDVLHVTVNQPDGSQTFVDLTAVTPPSTPNPGKEFLIDTMTPANTVLNLQAAVVPGKIADAYNSAGTVTTSFAGGTAAAVSFNVATQPAVGDTVRVVLALRDGTQETIELTARNASGAPLFSAQSFQIGATPADTAANLSNALQAAVQEKAQTSLSAASTTLAAADFFSGSPNHAPRRIAGPPFDGATAFAPSGSRSTLIWYAGDDTAPSARETAPVRTDSTQTVGTGAQANEPALRNLFAQLGALAAETFTAAPTESQRYSGLGERIRANLGASPGRQAVDDIAAELGNASAAMQGATDRHKATQAILQDTLDRVENASPEEVAASILQLQTRLQASYQTSAILAKLSLVNYL